MINAFPGYEFKQLDDGKFHNMYKGIDVGKGGYVYSEPGAYYNVVVFDSMSHHPHSAIAMNCFGDYTRRFEEILNARAAIKHKDYEAAGNMLGGVLKPFLTDDKKAKQIAQALKIAINSVYGLTAAGFDNPFKDPRNENNIVALRGALFMCNLKEFIESMGLQVISIKTDSIKVVNPPKNMLDKINKYAKDYGYVFEIEHVFDRICLVNDSVFIAKCSDEDPEDPGQWTATGAQFAVPYVFKTLFSHEPLEFKDFCETKTVSKGEIFVDMDEDLPDGEHSYHFVGRAGQFTPIKKGKAGGILYRKQNDKYYAIAGTKGYRWLESEMVSALGKEEDIDESYYIKLANEAKASINEYCDFEKFISD